MSTVQVPESTVQLLKEILAPIPEMYKAMIASFVIGGDPYIYKDGDDYRWANKVMDDVYYFTDIPKDILANEGKLMPIENISGSSMISASEYAVEVGFIHVGETLYQKGLLHQMIG